MATTDLAAKRYAEAAFQLALEKDDLERWTSAIEQISAFTGEADIRRTLENTRVGQDVKQRLIQAGLGSLPPLMLNFARLLVKKGRTPLIGAIEAEFRTLVEEQRGITRARALTAVPLTDLEREALTRALFEQTGKEVVLETAVDPALLGGIVVQIGDKLVDASTRARLQALRESLTGAVG